MIHNGLGVRNDKAAGNFSLTLQFPSGLIKACLQLPSFTEKPLGEAAVHFSLGTKKQTDKMRDWLVNIVEHLAATQTDS